MKYHITEDGPKICRAKTPETCIVLKSGQTLIPEHYENKEEAEKSYSEAMEAIEGLTMTITPENKVEELDDSLFEEDDDYYEEEEVIVSVYDYRNDYNTKKEWIDDAVFDFGDARENYINYLNSLPKAQSDKESTKFWDKVRKESESDWW